uniref:EGF-like domain-containing protein n=1 Tax=Stomoxys calcitrans TaxID=35570 RepID=A0A1I8PVV4_STOCA
MMVPIVYQLQIYWKTYGDIYQTKPSNINKFDANTDTLDTLSARLSSITLLKYSSYRDVSILHFLIPPDTRRVLFTFKATEQSSSILKSKCVPRNVNLHLKARSFPVISPENITFPKSFLNNKQRFKTHSLQFQSNGVLEKLLIEGPYVGNWFAVAFLSWTDPTKDRIEQQGIAASCETLLMAEMSLSIFNPIITSNRMVQNNTLLGNYEDNCCDINNSCNNNNKAKTTSASYKERPHKADIKASSSNVKPEAKNIQDNDIVYKLFIPRNVEVATAFIDFAEKCLRCPLIGFYTQANALPYLDDNNEELGSSHSIYVQANRTETISFMFNVQPLTWHYILLKYHSKNECLSEESVLSDVKSENSTKNEKYNLKFALRIEYTDANEKHKDNSTDKANLQKPIVFRNITFYPLHRQSHREFFTFNYSLVTNENYTMPSTLNVTAGAPVGLEFYIGDVYDIGGTLTFSAFMENDNKESEKDISPSSSNSFENPGTGDHVSDDDEFRPNSEARKHKIIIVCMHHGQPSEPLWPDKCRHGHRQWAATSIINSKNVSENSALLHVPYPESGNWFVTMRLFCNASSPVDRFSVQRVKEFVNTYRNNLDSMHQNCDCSPNMTYYKKCLNDPICFETMNEKNILKFKECLLDVKCTSLHLEMTEKFKNSRNVESKQFAPENCSTSVSFSISSKPCINGTCGHSGHCYHYMSGGFVFSSCVCTKGYRGWDCNDDSQVLSEISTLVASLLLILSNLFFIPSVYIAARRKFGIESLIYFFAMFFSIFYHACDSGEEEYSFCLLSLEVLQFCDFYCGLLAIWVTLLAMAQLGEEYTALLHMLGAILLALGTEVNKQSLWVFLTPVLTGVILIGTSWGVRCYKTRQCFPARKYLLFHMPIGCVLVICGLVCYAFVATRQNYYIVHSIWHVVMALSIVCLLPSSKLIIAEC